MLSILILAGLTITPVDLKQPVLDVRVVDIDADGEEDIVAVTQDRLLLFRSGKQPAKEHPAAPLTVVGHGLLGVVRDGRYHPVEDPFGEFKEGAPGPHSLLAAHGNNTPRLLDSPGDLDGDGRADAVLATREGMFAPAGLLPVRPEARLLIERNENFAIEYQIPVPVVGNWSGKARELVFFHENAVVSFHGKDRTDRLPLPLTLHGKGAESIRRNHVLVRDIDGDARLDLVVVIARGTEGLFGEVEAAANVWLGGRIFDRKRKGFYKRAAYVKVDGALIAPALVDVDGDGDLDLVLSTIRTALVGGATGSAPGTYHVFRFTDGGYERKPVWTLESPVPMSTFTARPVPPVTFLTDIDGSHRPKAVQVGDEVVLFEADGDTMRATHRTDFASSAPPSCGRRLAVMRGKSGLLLLAGRSR